MGVCVYVYITSYKTCTYMYKSLLRYKMSISCQKNDYRFYLVINFADGINFEVNTATPCHIDWLFKKKTC